MEVTETLKELFFDYEDRLQIKAVVSNIPEIDEIYAGVILDPDFYDEDGERLMKVSITIQCHSISLDELDQIDEDTREAVSDLVNDWLMGPGELGLELEKINIDSDILNWFPVKFVAV